MARQIVIGDIHGCWDELQALLDAAGATRDDEIIAIGDIVDRGPASERVLAFFRDRPGARSIMGNHERKHTRSARGEIPAALSQTIVRAELGERYGEWLAFMATFPRCLDLSEALLVHGFWEPGVPLERQRDEIVIGTMSGEQHLSKNYPGPWYDHYDGAKPLVFGHHDYMRNGQPLVREGRLYGIDTGCVYGGHLTALVLPEFRTVSVRARENYWRGSKKGEVAEATADGYVSGVVPPGNAAVYPGDSAWGAGRNAA